MAKETTFSDEDIIRIFCFNLLWFEQLRVMVFFFFFIPAFMGFDVMIWIMEKSAMKSPIKSAIKLALIAVAIILEIKKIEVITKMASPSRAEKNLICLDKLSQNLAFLPV